MAARALPWILLCFIAGSTVGKEVVVVSKTSTVKGDYKCSGKQDDKVIQEAIDQVAKSGGGTVTLSDGIFAIENQIWLDSDITFQGQGMEETTLRLVDNAPQWKNAGQVRAKVAAENIFVRQLTIDGNRKNQKKENSKYGKYGFYVQKSINVSVDYVMIKSCVHYGFDPHGEAKTNNAGKGLRITNCVAEDNGWDGIAIDKNEDVYLYNNTLRDNLRHGLNICCGCKRVVALNNTIEHNGPSAALGEIDNSDVIVQSNLLHGKMYNTTDVVIMNNKITTDRKVWGLIANNADKVQFISNTVNGVSRLCILYRDSDYGTADSNRCNNTAKTYVIVDGDYTNETFNVEKQTVVEFKAPNSYYPGFDSEPNSYYPGFDSEPKSYTLLGLGGASDSSP